MLNLCLVLITSLLPSSVSLTSLFVPLEPPASVPGRNLPLGVPQGMEGLFKPPDPVSPSRLSCPSQDMEYLRDKIDEKLKEVNPRLIYNCTSEEAAQSFVNNLEGKVKWPKNRECKSSSNHIYRYLCNTVELKEDDDDDCIVATAFAQKNKQDIRKVPIWDNEAILFGCSSIFDNYTVFTACAFRMHSSFDMQDFDPFPLPGHGIH